MARKLQRSRHESDDSQFAIEVANKTAAIVAVPQGGLNLNRLSDILQTVQDAIDEISSN